MAVIKDKTKCDHRKAAPLVSGAVLKEFDPKEHYVVCADAGLRYRCAVRRSRPDTCSSAILTPANPETIRTIKLPVEKGRYRYDGRRHGGAEVGF